jgi:hypothetical protein
MASKARVVETAADPRLEAEWLRRIVYMAILVRVAGAVAFHVAGVSGRLAPDEFTYEDIGRTVAAYFNGDLLIKPTRLISGEPSGYYYLNGASLYLFGSILPLKVLNAIMGGLVCRYAYLLALPLYGLPVARRTAQFVAFFTSLILWSTLNIRDVWVIFLIVYLSWKSYDTMARYSAWGLFQILGCLLLISSFRQYLYVVVAIPPVASLIIGKRSAIARNMVMALLAGAAVVLLVQHGAASRSLDMLDLETLAQKRQGMATGAQSSFQEAADISTPAKALAYLPTGLAYFWFSPFPWQMTSPLKLLSLPEVLLVYWITLSVIRGISVAVRTRLRESVQVLLLTALMTVSYALGSGNVGTLYRHRAQVMVFYLMFASVGMEERARQKGARRAPASLSGVDLTTRRPVSARPGLFPRS